MAINMRGAGPVTCCQALVVVLLQLHLLGLVDKQILPTTLVKSVYTTDT